MGDCKRCGIVAAKMGGRVLAPFQYRGTMDSSLFEFWFSHQLLPSLDKGTVIVMDIQHLHGGSSQHFCGAVIPVQFADSARDMNTAAGQNDLLSSDPKQALSTGLLLYVTSLDRGSL